MKERKPVVWFVVGCVIACICGGIAAISVTFWLAETQTADDIILELETPGMVSNGDNFLLVIRLINVGAETQGLLSINIDDSYLKSFAVNNTSPSYENYTIQDDFLGSWHHFYFDRDLAAEEKLEVTFSLTALQSGSFSGPVDVCISNKMDCLRNTLRTIVE